MANNVYGKPLISCCTNPMTGYFRDGFCRTMPQDTGTHVVCAVVTKELLAFTKQRGNDLTRPIPQWQFPGLQPGDKWCLCISRWLEAYKAGVAPKIDLNATHEKALEFTKIEVLEAFKL
ncbi:DUF2237 family protein [Winogradskyella sp.]